jgi:hypothetical protein
VTLSISTRHDNPHTGQQTAQPRRVHTGVSRLVLDLGGLTFYRLGGPTVLLRGRRLAD